MMAKPTLLLAMLLALAVSQADAAIDLLPKLVEVQGKTATRVTVINRSDHPEFVTISLSRLLNPGVPWRLEQLEPVGLVNSPDLYAYPLKLSLAKGQSKVVTLQPLATVPQERVWRLIVTPVTALGGPLSAISTGGVAVNLSFSALIRQLPEKQTRELHSLCSADAVTLTATGTTRYRVKGMTLDGVPLDDFNVYPGTPATMSGQHAAVAGKKLCH